MERTRAYRRSQRNRAIARKKGAIKRISGGRFEWYSIDGKYSKGKIHCSCQMCRGKDQLGKHILTKTEIIAIEEYLNAKRLYEGREITECIA